MFTELDLELRRAIVRSCYPWPRKTATSDVGRGPSGADADGSTTGGSGSDAATGNGGDAAGGSC